MNSVLRIFILFCGLFFDGIIFYLLMKRRLSERNSLFWLAGSAVILVISAAPDLLEGLADFVGVDYPPALLFLFSILVLLLIILNQSIQISILSEQLKELTQHVAINKLSEEKSPSIEASGGEADEDSKGQVCDNVE